MSITDDLYREIILDHFKNPRNHGRLESPDLTAQGANPFCGDEMEITLALQGETLREVRFQAKGCSISQASASMMTEVIKGKGITEVKELAKRFKAIMLENAPGGVSAAASSEFLAAPAASGEKSRLSGASDSGSHAPMNFPPELEDLESLEGVKKYPVRIKCAILSWNTLLEGIEAHRHGKAQASHVEGEEGNRPNLTQQLTEEKDEGGKGEGNDLTEQVRTTLKSVMDPELNMNVVDLGLIYGIDIQGSAVKVIYTLTSPGCPLGPVIKGQMQSALGRLAWVKEIQPELVWTPPWDPRTMASEEAKTELGIW